MSATIIWQLIDTHIPLGRHFCWFVQCEDGARTSAPDNRDKQKNRRNPFEAALLCRENKSK